MIEPYMVEQKGSLSLDAWLCIIYYGYALALFPNKPWFSRLCSTSLLKTLWEKEKLLETRNFSFSHSVFYPFVKNKYQPFS